MTSPSKRVDGEFVLPILALGADRRYAQLETGKSLSFEVDALATSRDAEQGGRNFGSRPTADIDAEKPTAGKPPASPLRVLGSRSLAGPIFRAPAYGSSDHVIRA